MLSVRLAALAVLACLVLPLASAQQPASLTAQPPLRPVAVGSDVTFNATVTVPCSLLPNGTAASGDLTLVNTPVWITQSAPATFTVGPCGRDPQVVVAAVTVHVSEDAPAFSAPTSDLVARVAGATMSTPVVLIADYYAKLTVTTPKPTLKAGPQNVLTFPISVRNRGNGITHVAIEVGALPEGWIVVKPSPITLQSDQSGGLITEGTVNLVVQTPHRFGYLDQSVQIPVYLNATAVGGASSARDASVVTLTAQVKGLDTPGPTLVLALGAVGVALVLRRLVKA